MSDNGHQLHLHFVFVDRYARIIREYDRHDYDRLQFIASFLFMLSRVFFYFISNNHEIPAQEPSRDPPPMHSTISIVYLFVPTRKLCLS